MIKYVLFDFGGVLTESGRKGFIAEILAELYAQNVQDMDTREYHAAFRRGKIDDEAFFGRLNSLYGKHITKEMFLQKMDATFKPAQPVFQFANDLRERGIKTGILSNVFAINAQVLREQGWYNNFAPIILSYEVGFAKPDREIYEIAIERCGVKADEILFVDDQEKCIKPATEFGMPVIKALSPRQTIADVRTKIWQLNRVHI